MQRKLPAQYAAPLPSFMPRRSGASSMKTTHVRSGPTEETRRQKRSAVQSGRTARRFFQASRRMVSKGKHRLRKLQAISRQASHASLSRRAFSQACVFRFLPADRIRILQFILQHLNQFVHGVARNLQQIHMQNRFYGILLLLPGHAVFIK